VKLVVDIILSVQLVVDVASFVSAAGIVVDVALFFRSVVDVTLLVKVVVTGLLVGFRELVVDSTLLVRLAIPVDNVVKLSTSWLVAVSDKPIPASVCSNNLVVEADRLVDSVALVKPALVAFGSRGPPVWDVPTVKVPDWSIATACAQEVEQKDGFRVTGCGDISSKVKQCLSVLSL
jgi:hypothetical protein